MPSHTGCSLATTPLELASAGVGKELIERTHNDLLHTTMQTSGFYKPWLGVADRYRQLWEVTGHYGQLLTPSGRYAFETTGSYWQLLAVTGSYWLLLAVTVNYWQLLTITDNYESVLVIRGDNCSAWSLSQLFPHTARTHQKPRPNTSALDGLTSVYLAGTTNMCQLPTASRQTHARQVERRPRR